MNFIDVHHLNFKYYYNISEYAKPTSALYLCPIMDEKFKKEFSHTIPKPW